MTVIRPRLLYAIDAESHPRPTFFACGNLGHQVRQIEFLSTVKNRLRMRIGRITVNQIARPGPLHEFAVIRVDKLTISKPQMPSVDARTKGFR